MIKVAVVGVGSMGKNHVRVYSEMDGVELVGVCDKDEVSVKNIADKHRTKHFTDLSKMLEECEIDAVSLCVPTKFHKQVALQIIDSNINLLVEKPIASSVDEGLEIIKAAKGKGVKLMIGHIERFNPVIVELKKRIQNNELGKIFMIKSERFSPFPKRILDVGVTLDLSVHDVDVMQYLLGSKVSSVYGVNSQKIHSTDEDLMTSIMRFENDVIGTTSCNWITPKIVREISVIGEKGMFKADYLTQELFHFKNEFTDKNIDWGDHNLTITKGDEIKINIEKKEPLFNELRSFVECIEKGTEVPITGEEGLDALNVVLQFLDSAKTNEVKTI